MRWLIAIAELGLLCWFVAVGIEAAIQRAFTRGLALPSPFRLREFHHAWLGAGLVILGLCINSVTGCLVQLLGVVLSLDDTFQHLRQTFNGELSFRSPLHQLFARTLWRAPGIPWLCAKLDDWWFVGVVLGLLSLWVFG